MITIDVKKYVPGTPETETWKVEVPALPQTGNYLSSDKHGFDGYVQSTIFWWDERGALIIEVTIK